MHGERGRYSVADMVANINPADSHYARTSLVAVEDTCNKGGGAVWDLSALEALSMACRERELKFHWMVRGMECMGQTRRMGQCPSHDELRTTL